MLSTVYVLHVLVQDSKGRIYE
jgi:hypothetical protein